MGAMLRGFFLLALVVVSEAKAGPGSSGGGGDNPLPEVGSAWFTGERVIRYCVSTNADFGVAPSTLHENIEEAFETWSHYIISRKVLPLKFGKEAGLYLALNREFLPKCDGSEDLKFFFGVTNQDIEVIKKLYSNPDAFAHRNTYDMKTGWGKGLIWFAAPGTVSVKAHLPDWTLSYRLQGMLLHEIGHVLGCGHVEGTIMTKYISRFLQPIAAPDESIRFYLTRIDHEHELAPCDNCYDYKGLTSLDAFLEIVGRQPKGSINARFHAVPPSGAPFLEISDAIGTLEIRVHVGFGGGTSFHGAGDLFRVAKRVVESKGVLTGAVGRVDGGFVEHGTIQNSRGETLPLDFAYNASNGPATLEYLDKKGAPHLLFRSTLPRLR